MGRCNGNYEHAELDSNIRVSVYHKSSLAVQLDLFESMPQQ